MLNEFFSEHGKVVEFQIIHGHETNHSRGFGFILFDSEEIVDELISTGNMIDMASTRVSTDIWFLGNEHVHKFLPSDGVHCFISRICFRKGRT